MRVLGLAGWSGAGKTTLLVKLIPVLTGRGLRVATVKHAHHGFEVDHPGKDSYAHREAGAAEVLVSSARRTVQIRELRDEPEPVLPDLLRRLSPCDLVFVEGFKHARHPKLEVFRTANGRPALHPDDPDIRAVASDCPFPAARPPVIALTDIEAIAEGVPAWSEPMADVLRKLDGAA